ncbi:MAG: hypothetical protein CMP23_06590 [Rickettsiales bacterium]|nr:hypothetical protein [Rickettsiales bacterium]
MERQARNRLTAMDSFDKGLRALLWLNLGDAIATLTWVQLGLATEANPIMNWALHLGPSIFVLSKVALVCLAAALLWTHRSHLSARAALIPAACLYALIGGAHLGFAVLHGLHSGPVQLALGLSP